MRNIYIKYFVCFIIIAFPFSVYLILTQSDPRSENSKTFSAAMEKNQNIESKYKPEIETSFQTSDKDTTYSNKSTDKTREIIESETSDDPIESGWLIIDNCKNPCAGVHVVCTPISCELIREWLDMDERGLKPSPKLLETYTDNDGHFDFPHIEPDLYLIRADATGWSPALGTLDLRSGRPDEFTAVMLPEKIIHGKVLDCNQHPMKEVLISCYLAPTQAIDKAPLHRAGEIMLFDQKYITDEKGEFEFRGLYPDPVYILYADYEGFIPIDRAVTGNDRSDQILFLKKACILEGRILSIDGKPLPDATVTYYEPQSPYSGFNIDLIDKEGRFRSEEIPEGFIRLQGMHEDYGHDIVMLDIKSDKTNFAELKLPKGIKLQLTVTDEQDNPLEGIRVTVRSQDSGACLCSSSTDKFGKIVVNSLRKGDRNSIYAKDHKGSYTVYDKTYTFTEDSKLKISMNRRFLTQMVVMDESTREIISDYKACVTSYYKSSALQESTGLNIQTFEYDIKTPCFKFQIAKGEYFEITVFAEGYMPQHVSAQFISKEELKPIEVMLSPGQTLTGCILDADTFKAVSNAQIQLYINGVYDKKPGFPLSKDKSTSNKKDGSFSLLGMPDYHYFLKITAPGYAPTIVDSLELKYSASADDNRIFIRKGGSLAGRVFNLGGGPLDQAFIQVRLMDTNDLLTVRSRSDGSYSFHDLPSGEYEVSANDVLNKVATNSIMKLQKRVRIVPGQTTTADFTFEGSCIIRGLCTVDGREGCGIVIHLFDDKGVKTHSVDSSSTGFYMISSITPGSYTLEAHSTVIAAGGMIRRPITLQNGQDLTLDLDFKGKAVYGIVTNAEGQPIHAAQVELLTPSFQRNYLTYTDYEGSYTIFNVDEGDYFVIARAPGCGEEMKGPWILGGTQKSGRKVDFALKPGGAVRMLVNDFQGNPIPNAKVLLSNNMSQGVLWTEKTKYSGIAVFDNLQTESLSALAIGKGYAAGSTTLIAPTGEITDAEITLTPGGSFKLTVKNKNGILISDAQVTITNFSLLGLSPTCLTQLGLLSPSDPGYLTDEKGVFSLGLLPPGNYRLQITKGSHATQEVISITSGQETGTQVILE